MMDSMNSFDELFDDLLLFLEMNADISYLHIFYEQYTHNSSISELSKIISANYFLKVSVINKFAIFRDILWKNGEVSA